MKVGSISLRELKFYIQMNKGHKLKSATNKTTSMFKSLRTPRRIILSGTPIQNDLGEFHTMVCSLGCLPLAFLLNLGICVLRRTFATQDYWVCKYPHCLGHF